MLYLISSISLVSAGYGVASSSFSQGSLTYNPQMLSFPEQSSAQPMKMETYMPAASSFSQGSSVQPLATKYSTFSQESWVQPMQMQSYTPEVSSFSQGSNINPFPEQSFAQPMKMETYMPAASSFSQGSSMQPSTTKDSSFAQGAWVQPMQMQSYTPEVSSFSQGSNIAVQPIQMNAYSSSYTPMTPKVSSFSQGALVSAPLISNPYQIGALKNMPSQVVVSRQKTAGMPVQNQYIGEEHVIHNDLKVHENHQTDKTILTKKIVHHAPVLHKTIRTHEIAEDTVHDKLVHHLNTVEDQWKRVPGQSYVGNQKTVDHTKPFAPAPKFEAPTIPQTVRVAPHNA